VARVRIKGTPRLDAVERDNIDEMQEQNDVKIA
jgi:hypothetical protein